MFDSILKKLGLISVCVIVNGITDTLIKNCFRTLDKEQITRLLKNDEMYLRFDDVIK